MTTSRKITSRDRFTCALAHKTADRIPMAEICVWPQTLERWKTEGMPADASPLAYFGLDEGLSYGFDCSLQLETKVIEETEEWKTAVNSDGVTMKTWKNSFATPVELDFAVKTRSDWDQLKPRLRPDWRRFHEPNLAAMAERTAQGSFVTISPLEPCWYALRTLGHKECLELMALEPEFIEDIIATQTDLVLAMLEMGLSRGMKCDALWFFSDLCYRSGMLFSPATYRRMVQPYHRRFKDFCVKHNLFFILHCDGDVRNFIPLLIESGFDCIQPLEARAGNDVRLLKKAYGKDIAFFGNINMDVLARGDKAEITEEVVTKVTAAQEGGGYIYHSDHSVPPTVSLASYSLALDLARKHGGY